jgi:hypothetical protein
MFQDTIQLGTIVGVGTVVLSVFSLGWKISDWLNNLTRSFDAKFARLEIRLARMDALIGNGHARGISKIKEENGDSQSS